MSTPTPSPAPTPGPAPAPAPAPTPAPAAATGEGPEEILIISHSNLFYWWPVWAVGFILAFLTWLEGYRMVLVPSGADAQRNWQVVVGVDKDGKDEKQTREGVILPPGGKLLPSRDDPSKAATPKLYMASRPAYGVVWATVLLVVIFITNVPLRGLWSVIIIVMIVLLSVIFGLAGWWDDITHALGLLDIRINLAGYMAISLVLFIIWLVAFMFFDRQVYMIFTSGQAKVCTEIGGGETSFDTMGMVIDKHRDDLFRHWVLGLGSGDLTVKTAGATPQVFHLHNVLFVGRKLQLIEEMQREKAVVKG